MPRRQWILVSLSQIWVGQLGSISGGETGSRIRPGVTFTHPHWISSISYTHTHTTEGTCTHVHTHTLEGLLRLPNCDLTKMLIIVKWTPPYPRFPYELFILLLWFQPFFHEVTAPFSVWIQASTDFLLLLLFFFHPLVNFPDFSLLFPFGLSYPSSLLRSWSAVFN